MKQTYAKPEMEIVHLDLDNLVRTSSNLDEDETERLPLL